MSTTHQGGSCPFIFGRCKKVCGQFGGETDQLCTRLRPPSKSANAPVEDPDEWRPLATIQISATRPNRNSLDFYPVKQYEQAIDRPVQRLKKYLV
jgi:hypothetical protein